MEKNVKNLLLLKEFFGTKPLDYHITCNQDFNSYNNLYFELNKGKIKKRMYYNVKLGQVVSNVIDGRFNLSSAYKGLTNQDFSMLISYEVNGLIRPFIGFCNTENGYVYPIGYDVIKNEYIEFPMNELGLVDDDEMKRRLQEESEIGYEEDYYNREAYCGNLRYIISTLTRGKVFTDSILDNIYARNYPMIDKGNQK
jgi:hypothetical protein